MHEVLNFTWYSAVFGLFALGCVYDTQDILEANLKKLGTPYTQHYGGRYKYLTFLDMNLQAIFNLICLLSSFYKLFILKSYKNGPNKVENFYFTSAAFPFGFIVSVMFWGLYFIEPELVWPKMVEELVPNWQNHVMHTLPIVSVMFECFNRKYEYEKSFFKGMLPTAILGTSYVIWTFIIAYRGGFWVYPVMEVLNVKQRALFISFLWVFIGGIYKLGQILNSLRLSTENKKKSS